MHTITTKISPRYRHTLDCFRELYAIDPQLLKTIRTTKLKLNKIHPSGGGLAHGMVSKFWSMGGSATFLIHGAYHARLTATSKLSALTTPPQTSSPFWLLSCDNFRAAAG